MAYEDAPAAGRPGPTFASYRAPKKRKNEAALARRYAQAQLALLSRAGLVDDEGDISALASEGAQSGDPALLYRALSSRVMALHGAQGLEGEEADPRVWLRNRAVSAQGRRGMMARMQPEVEGQVIPEGAQNRAAMAAEVMAKMRQATAPQSGLSSALAGIVQRLRQPKRVTRAARRGMMVE
jgi:hypothetical protein